jgi:hypothetical protein
MLRRRPPFHTVIPAYAGIQPRRSSEDRLGCAIATPLDSGVCGNDRA